MTQEDADALFAVEKRSEDGKVHQFPAPGGQFVAPIVSIDGRERLVLTMRRGRIKLEQASYQNLARANSVLRRLDLDGPPHTNPDGIEIECPHLHVYREGWGDKWAESIDPQVFTDVSDIQLTLSQFMRYCNITSPPPFQMGIL